MPSLSKNYYISSFFWSMASRVLSAVVGFITVPLLLGVYGKADYGILALATSCNGYMQLLDLGMNTGAVKFFAQWKSEKKYELIYRVLNTNITFYLIISVINILLLLLLATFGEPMFNITHEQFLILQRCLVILAVFNVFSWETTPFQQLLQAYKKMSFVMQMQALTQLLKLVLIGITIFLKLSLTIYFFFLTAIISSLIIPYAIKCKKDKMILSFQPKTYWSDFKIVLSFSISIFALSVFQATAMQSRPIILSMLSSDGAGAVADFRILEVIPSFIIMLSGTFCSIFLPTSTELVHNKNQKAIQNFSYKWTRLTTIVVDALCFPFIIAGKEALSAYVGPQYSYLYVWLCIWIMTVIWQMHTTPGYALVLSYGKTRQLVIVTAMSCVLSIVINCGLCRYFEVGSSIIGYAFFVFIIQALYYVSFYKKLLGLNRFTMFLNFLKPTLIAVIAMLICMLIPFDNIVIGNHNRFYYLALFLIKALSWFVPYVVLLFLFKQLSIAEIKNARK